jgi:hypothetical protein
VGARIDADDLVGAAEIAERLGLASTSVVRDWRLRHADFPAPVRRLRMGSVWRWSDVERWARATGRLP